MVKSGERRFADDDLIDAVGQNSDVEESSSGNESPATANPSISRRLTDIFLEDGDEDFLMRTDAGDGSLQWLEALDMQVMGACRADERLKPLLKLNISGGEAEDRLLAQLCEHFEPSEVGVLARCLCAPLVSIRVGKIDKQGKLLCPTSMRGNLSLTLLLPTSALRISFNGDDGSIERLATVSSETDTTLEIEEISADKTGRSFLLRIADNVVCYFWCSEKSQLLGREMLRKMKDLLIRKPSLAELTGISDDRLNSFATHLKACIGGSVVSNAQSSGVCPSDDVSFGSSGLHFLQSSFTCEKTSQFQQYSCQESTSLLKSLSSRNITAAERLMQAGDDDVLPNSSSLTSTNNNVDLSNAIGFSKDKLPEADLVDSFGVINIVDAFGKPLDLPPFPNEKILSSSSSRLSPQYCWCPPVASTLHYTLRNSHIPSLSAESFCLPPLSSMPSAGGGSSKSSRSLSEAPAMDFPSLPPEPLISSLPTSQQIPTFTPLMCDSIAHIPIYSSGPGYLFSAGLAVTTTTIPPLNLKLMVPPLVPASESVVEQSARETLRMLINGTNGDEKQNAVGIIGGSSSGFYCGPTTMSLMFLSEKLRGVGRGVGSSDDDSVDKQEQDTGSLV